MMSVCWNMESEGPIPLLPLNHQVGGHTSVLCYDNDTICKPLVSQEQRFYETLPREMRNFTPKYKGIILVSLRRDSRGHLGLIARSSINAHSHSDVTGDNSMEMLHNVKQRQNLGAERGLVNMRKSPTNPISDSCPESSSYRAECHFHSEISCQIGGPGVSHMKQVTYNPWGLHCHQQHLSRMSSEHHQNQIHKYLLLENVASKFSLPCVLDLKMGTRQHGDDASEEKKARHMEKCAQSTSATLGVRISGMQVYQADTGQFLCKDKYYGRKLTTEGFQQALYQFLHNGYHLRTDLIDSIIYQLMSLKSVIECQGSYRFYSSSLLIVYDGEQYTKANYPCLQKLGDPTTCLEHISDKVDVRMIDFAHTTYTGSRNSSAVHEGPDQGYIFGIENLVKIFHNIKEEL
ncbi:inositol hexakisphosphate kinase 3 [Rhinophrynus dorsalis]